MNLLLHKDTDTDLARDDVDRCKDDYFLLSYSKQPPKVNNGAISTAELPELYILTNSNRHIRNWQKNSH